MWLYLQDGTWAAPSAVATCNHRHITRCQQSSDATRATNAPSNNPKLPVVSQRRKQQPLENIYYVCQGRQQSQMARGKKKKKKKKVWKEYPEVLNSNLPLEAGPAPVRLGCWELCPTKLWKSPRLNVLKSLWIHVLGLYCSHYQQCFCSCPSGISFATACGTASDLSAQAPTAQRPLISRCATSTHPRQKHLYRQWTSQTQPQNWEPPKQVPPVS